MSAREFLKIEFPKETILQQENNAEITMPFAASGLFRAQVINAELLTRGEDVKKVYEITINTEHIDYKFEPGDTVGIVPLNNAEEVDEILNILQLQKVADSAYALTISEKCEKKNATIPKHLPKTGTVRNLFTKYLDIRSPPKKIFLKMLADSATAETDREKLIHICSPNGADSYSNLIAKEGRTLIGLLKTFPSCKCLLERLLEYLPPIKPRPYSIASSPLISNELKIVFSVIYDENGSKGVCTGYLEKIANNYTIANYSVDFYFRKPTKFRLPQNNSIPLIMIGPGTGIAPFIGFLQHRNLLKLSKEETRFGKTWLFFGCRYSDRDYLYSKEIKAFMRNTILNNISVAFSRMDKKNYVQHEINNSSREFYEWITEDENTVIYVCGDGRNMARDVKKAVIDVFVKYEEKTVEEAEKFVKHLITSERYIEDIWS